MKSKKRLFLLFKLLLSLSLMYFVIFQNNCLCNELVRTNLLETVVSVPALVVVVVARVAPDLSRVAFLKSTFSSNLKINEKGKRCL